VLANSPSDPPEALTLTPRLLRLAAAVINESSREKPADSVLRNQLAHSPGFSRLESALVARTVFNYFRWLGWVDPAQSIEAQIQETVEIAERYARNPKSIPDPEMLELGVPSWVRAHFEVTAEWARSLQAPTRLWLRAKPGTGRVLAARLGNSKVLGPDKLSDALAYEGERDLFRSSEFHEGAFEVQDVSSQAVGWTCEPEPGESWWDACAGEGGKTLHLCAMMRAKGLVMATDRAEWRLEKLKRRAKRAQAFNYRIAVWDGSPNLPKGGPYDGVLVDAPCSGIGTWQRNPQARWTTNETDVLELAALQKQLLGNVIKAIKPGGRLIYSVCTLPRAETSEIASWFDESFPEFQRWEVSNPFERTTSPARDLVLWPQQTRGNGMFIAQWRKKRP
jgi:16S rRNA (cytosine967-C5)-methyltransferase